MCQRGGRGRPRSYVSSRTRARMSLNAGALARPHLNAPEGHDRCSQPYSHAVGMAKWRWNAITKKACLVGRRQSALFVAYLKARPLLPPYSQAISLYLKARLYGWLPLSDVSGIVFPGMCKKTAVENGLKGAFQAVPQLRYTAKFQPHTKNFS